MSRLPFSIFWLIYECVFKTTLLCFSWFVALLQHFVIKFVNYLLCDFSVNNKGIDFNASSTSSNRKYIQVCVHNVSDVNFTLADMKLTEKQHVSLELQSLNTKTQQVREKNNTIYLFIKFKVAEVTWFLETGIKHFHISLAGLSGSGSTRSSDFPQGSQRSSEVTQSLTILYMCLADEPNIPYDGRIYSGVYGITQFSGYRTTFHPQ